MLKNYLLVALRNLWKHKSYFFINVGGMTVALICSIFILLVVYQNITFDDFFTNKDKLYKLYSSKNGRDGVEQETYMPYLLRNAILNENTGVTKASGIVNCGKLVRYKDKMLDMGITLVDPDFMSMFSVEVIKGDAANPLYDLSSNVLTENTARKLFGKEDPIGKQIEVKLGKQWKTLIVSAIVKDMPTNSSVRFSLLGRMEMHPDYNQEKDNWGWLPYKLYVQLADNVGVQQVESRLQSIIKKYIQFDVKYENELGYTPDKYGNYLNYHLLPLTKEHFNLKLGSNTPVNKSLLYVLILISVVVLLIACFNFVNLTISSSYTRAKEIGVRKCLGADKRQIWFQIWGESTIVVLLAMVLALLGVVILIPLFNQLFDNRLEAGLLLQPRMLMLFITLLIIVSFLASGYPSFIMSRQKTIGVLKGRMAVNRPGLVRNGLIVAQFAIAIVLIVCTIVILQQFNYLRSVPLGYNTKAVISIPLKNEENGKMLVRQLRASLANQPGVLAVSGSDVNVGMGEDKVDHTALICMRSAGNAVCGQVIYADCDFLKTLDIKPVSGHDFTVKYANDKYSIKNVRPKTDKPILGKNETHIEAIFSEGYAALFGLKEIQAGSVTTIAGGLDDGAIVTIVAVIPDILFQSLKSKQYPLVIYNSVNNNSMSYAFVKVTTTNPAATMKMIEKAYATLEPGVEFKGSYVNENIDRLYRSEQVLANLLTLVAGIAIFLSCMGLFGMASIIIRQRTKEIGVRKVLGASVSSIVVLVNKTFIKPIIFSFLLATPIAWWSIHLWLQDYSYRVNLHWWVFALTGMLTLLIAICTISFQSIKAAIVNPVKSLKSE